MANITSNFEDTPLWPEVEAIVHSGDKKVLYDYRGTVHTVKEDIRVWDLISVEIVRDYVTETGESAKVVFFIGLGDYTNRLFPYRDNLEFTLKKVPMDPKGSEKSKNLPTEVMKYKVIFNASNNPPVGAGELESLRSEDLNNSDIVEVHLELVDRSLEPLRIKTTRGAWRNVTPETVIRSIIGSESGNVLVDGKPAIDGLDLVDPDNTTPIHNLVLPDGIMIATIPTYLQQTVSGVYNRGIGTYFQRYNGKKFWFIYPLYDEERFDGKGKRMIFYAVPQEKLPQLDKSWRVEGDIYKVAVTAQRRYADSAELGYMNEGSGFRVADADAYMKKPVELLPDKVVANRARLNREVIIKERTDNLNYAPVPKTGPSSNPYVYRSAVKARSMAQIDLVWENADSSVIYPGMPCKYVYLSQGKAISLTGTILFVHVFTARVERQNASAFRTTCRISISAKAQDKPPQLPYKESIGNAE